MFGVTTPRSDGMFICMDAQTTARLRLMDARLVALEMAVLPRPIKRTIGGLPLPPDPWEPGELIPKTDWVCLRVNAIEMVLRWILDLEEERALDDGDVPLKEMVEERLGEAEGIADEAEADGRNFEERLKAAAIRQAAEVLQPPEN